MCWGVGAGMDISPPLPMRPTHMCQRWVVCTGRACAWSARSSGFGGLQTEGSARHILSGDKLPTRLIAVTLALVRWPRQLSYTEPVVLETG